MDESSPWPATPDPAQEALSHEGFLKRGEQAWQEYLRTGLSVPAEEVFAEVQALIDARWLELVGGQEAKPSED